MTIEPFLSRLPNYLEQDQDTKIYFRELIDWIEGGFLNFRQFQTQQNLNVDEDAFVPANRETQIINGEEKPPTFGLQNLGNATVTISNTSLLVLNGQVANVFNNGIALLDTFPSIDYRVEIRNGDGSNVRIRSNNKLINGQQEITITTQYTVRVIQYFIDTDEFGII